MTAIVVCTWGTGLAGGAAEVDGAFTVARKLAAEGAELRWLALGPLPEGASATAAAFGVHAIDHVEDASLGGDSADRLVAAVKAYADMREVAAILFPQTFDSRVVAPRVAGRLDAPVVMNAVEVERAGGALSITTSAYGGDTRVVYEVDAAAAPAVLAVMTNLVSPEPLASPAAEPVLEAVHLDIGSVEERIRVVEQPQVSGARLEEAEIIVSGGKGLGKAENYALIEELASALGGMAGASRPIVDEGWVDPSHQVGLTGKVTRPTLYLAAGISGASQHMAGCSGSKTIAAINTDKDASIFRYARFGVVADCVELLPELIRVAKQGGA